VFSLRYLDELRLQMVKQTLKSLKGLEIKMRKLIETTVFVQKRNCEVIDVYQETAVALL
jgi:hypothetical protein